MLGKKIQVKVTALDGETVKSEESDPVVYETPELVTAVRKAANSFTATFDSEADEIVKADDIEVISEDGTDVKKITGLDFSLDGLSAVVTVNTSFKDGVTYNVNYGDSTASFVASVGEVDKIVITTSEAEVNTPTKIEFALFDANGVDVTSAVKVDETCTVTFEGDYDNYNNKKASDSTVTMATAGSTCTVTVEYDKNDGETDQVTASKDITCVAASEKMGVPFFKQDPSDLNARSECYRFYDPKNSTDTNVKVEIDGDALVHFYAQDSDGSAISYDSYEIESADETVATAVIDRATGKWASFNVTGNSKGSVLLELKATKNGAETTYDIPVTVTEKAAPVKAKLGLSRTTMSNAWETEYYGEITVSVTAADGTAADENLYTINSIELKTKNKGVDDDLKDDPLYDGAATTGFRVNEVLPTALGDTYTAYAAESGSYVIEAEVTDLTSGKVLTARNTVTVKELPKEAWSRTGSNANALYAPIPFDDAVVAHIITDDADGKNEAFWSTLSWIDQTAYAALPTTTFEVGEEINDAKAITLKDGLKLADEDAIAQKDADDKTKGTAAVGDIAYFSGTVTGGETTWGTTALNEDGLKAAILAADADHVVGKKEVTAVATTTGPATLSTIATVADPWTLTTTPDKKSKGFAGKDAYGYAAATDHPVYNFYDGIGAKASYTIELSESDKTIGFKDSTCTMTARLAATMNGLFAGYVNSNGTIGDHVAGAGVFPTNTTGIVNVADIGMPLQIQTYFGKNMLNDDTEGLTELFRPTLTYSTIEDEPIGFAEGELGAAYLTKNALKELTENLDFFTAQKDQVKNDYDFAREGTYKVEFTYWKVSSNKATTESAAFTVKNDLYIPGVTVKSQTLDSYDQEGWATAVVSEVDLNNNDPSNYSVRDLLSYDATTGATATIDDAKTPAKWAVVEENGINFFKPLDRTFKLAS